MTLPPRHAPRWPAVLALLGIGAIYLLVSDRLSLGPSWLVLAVVVVWLVPVSVTHRRGLHHWARWLGMALVVLLTASVALSAVFLVTRLPRGAVAPLTLLEDAALIWVANILVFALWYWEVDAGGPFHRHRGPYRSVDFAFPQAIMGDGDAGGWRPDFVDYLFFAFNTSTAFSPTDTMVLSRRAKVLMMCQSVVSLVVIVVLAARAINTL